MSERILNRTAVREYALHVSEKIRNGKFTRVSEEFINAVEAELSATIRKMDSGLSSINPQDIAPVNDLFVTGEAMSRVRDKLDRFVQLVVIAKVRRHPSVGVTLKD